MRRFTSVPGSSCDVQDVVMRHGLPRHTSTDCKQLQITQHERKIILEMVSCNNLLQFRAMERFIDVMQWTQAAEPYNFHSFQQHPAQPQNITSLLNCLMSFELQFLHCPGVFILIKIFSASQDSFWWQLLKLYTQRSLQFRPMQVNFQIEFAAAIIKESLNYWK